MLLLTSLNKHQHRKISNKINHIKWMIKTQNKKMLSKLPMTSLKTLDKMLILRKKKRKLVRIKTLKVKPLLRSAHSHLSFSIVRMLGG